MQLSVSNGMCEGQNLGGILCVAEVHLSPKLLSDTAWVVIRSKWAMNVIMDYESLINKQHAVRCDWS